VEDVKNATLKTLLSVNKESEWKPAKSWHPTQKPIRLLKYLINMFTRDNGTVLDPFMGSGSTGVACKQMNRDFIGIEKEKEYFEIAKARIENEPNTLF